MSVDAQEEFRGGPSLHSDIVVRCPADETEIGRVADMGADEVAAVASALREAQPAWEDLGPAGRGMWVGRWRDWIIDHKDSLLLLAQREGGKSWGDASIETFTAAQVINYWVDNAERFLAPETVKASGVANKLRRLSVRHRPHPLVGVISPWNYPLAMPMLDVPAALMAGCAVLSKPSEVTPLAWSEAVRGWREIGAPPVLACATGRGDTGAAVVDVVDMVQFTGSTKTGRLIAARAGERLIPCGLELGGKDPMIVLADADLDRTINGALWGGFFNAGQSCTAVERVYVEAPVYDEFVRRLAEKVSALRQGMDAPGAYVFDLGALANAAQLAIVEGQVDDARAKGARVLCGGERNGVVGYFYQPTVLVDVDHSMACMRDETFGPILPVMKVAGEDEAVRLANDSDYGLSASVWSRDRRRAERIAERLEVGAVNINDLLVNVSQFPIPHSGWRDSGIGARFGGAQGILKYCRTQAQLSNRMEPRKEPQWYPYSPRLSRVVEFAGMALGARDWSRRLGLRRR